MSVDKIKSFMGIDISKNTLDIYWKEKFLKINNTPSAIEAFVLGEVILDPPTLCVFEATGGYERELRKQFQQAGIAVHEAHSSRVHAFGKACGHFAKTDKLDALLLYKYADFVSEKEQGDPLVDERVEEIAALRRLSAAMEKELHADKCRLKQMPKSCEKFLKSSIRSRTRVLKAIHKEIREKISAHADLAEKEAILRSMKGVGPKTAAVLIAELPELGHLSKKEIASLVGLAPKTQESGKKIGSAHIRGGRFDVRRALYMAVLSGIRCNGRIRKKYLELLARGKKKKVAMVAMMRKMIVWLNEMVRTGQHYQDLEPEAA